ncbi:glycosyltransferase family 2 protein [Albidovulum sediminicola]|uniref:Glycosyltransferase family 2 protein n=1 Tax=Albidovulum sediminicola TaxID=2984331 RepID=A0ABT2YYV2_9RHOB|nr:glycosyltransferase family 2 protein [Defluviimonas sp. WL0075]MCV2864056.1 glycosyltransferase family 2 protein [Defluviimonas sp. WL0075]
MPSVLVVIVNWRTAEMALAAAEAALIAMKGIDGAITIVDNDSGDGSEATLREGVMKRGWDRVRVIQSGRNGGYGAGNNVGIRAGLPEGGKPDYVYVLNPDAFPAPDAIRALVEHMERHPETGIAGSFVHGPDGVPHASAFRFFSLGSEFEDAAKTGPISRLLASAIVPLPTPSETTRVDWVSGASMMLRQSVLDRIGLFDEAYFLYFEETDLCLRAARAGYATDHVRPAQVTHIGSVSTGMKTLARVPAYWFDSRWRYFAKNHGRAYAIAATAARTAGGLLLGLRRLVGRCAQQNPPHFLRDLLAHGLRTGCRAVAPERGTATTAPAGSKT